MAAAATSGERTQASGPAPRAFFLPVGSNTIPPRPWLTIRSRVKADTPHGLDPKDNAEGGSLHVGTHAVRPRLLRALARRRRPAVARGGDRSGPPAGGQPRARRLIGFITIRSPTRFLCHPRGRRGSPRARAPACWSGSTPRPATRILARAAKLALEAAVHASVQRRVCASSAGGRGRRSTRRPPSPMSSTARSSRFGVCATFAVGLGSDEVQQRFDRGLDSLAANLHRYDTGSWRCNSLFPHPI